MEDVDLINPGKLYAGILGELGQRIIEYYHYFEFEERITTQHIVGEFDPM